MKTTRLFLIKHITSDLYLKTINGMSSWDKRQNSTEYSMEEVRRLFKYPEIIGSKVERLRNEIILPNIPAYDIQDSYRQIALNNTTILRDLIIPELSTPEYKFIIRLRNTLNRAFPGVKVKSYFVAYKMALQISIRYQNYKIERMISVENLESNVFDEIFDEICTSTSIEISRALMQNSVKNENS